VCGTKQEQDDKICENILTLKNKNIGTDFWDRILVTNILTDNSHEERVLLSQQHFLNVLIFVFDIS
jgi:hypothetical protein